MGPTLRCLACSHFAVCHTVTVFCAWPLFKHILDSKNINFTLYRLRAMLPNRYHLCDIAESVVAYVNACADPTCTLRVVGIHALFIHMLAALRHSQLFALVIA